MKNALNSPNTLKKDRNATRLFFALAGTLCLLACRGTVGQTNSALEIEVLKDAVIEPRVSGHGDEDGHLYYSRTTRPEPALVRLSKGQRFRMTESLGEGSCWIAFDGAKYQLESCPWLPGFVHTQADVFRALQP